MLINGNDQLIARRFLNEQRIDLRAVRYILWCIVKQKWSAIAISTAHQRPPYRRTLEGSEYYFPSCYRWGNAISFPHPTLSRRALAQIEI